MKKLIVSLLIALIIIDICTACSWFKKEEPTLIQITVANGPGSTASGISTINLYANMTDLNNNLPAYTQITDQYNQATIGVNYINHYYVVVTRGSAKNYYNGYLPVGIFQSQADVSSSPAQTPPGTVGGVKFKDINGDGIISTLDKTDAPIINISQGVTTSQTLTVY